MILIPDKIKQFSQIFKDNGHEIFLVGGAVRNLLMKKKPKDWDFTTSALPEDVIDIFKKVIPTGIKHGTVTVLFKGLQIEVTTYRIDGKYTDSRHPDRIQFSKSIYEDLKRRDFTINAMAYDVLTKELIDPHDGKKDINKRIIKAIGIPEERFNEDALRILRAVRFSSQLNFDIENKTLNAMKLLHDKLKNISAERIKDELIKIMTTDKPSYAFKIMEFTGILKIILPELDSCKGLMQKGFHDYDVFEHSIYSCDAADKNNTEIRFAALLHDLGKLDSFDIKDDKEVTFYKHEFYSEKKADDILKRLKFSNKFRFKVIHLIKYHMFNYQDNWTDSAVRRFIANVGIDNIDDLFALRLADQSGMSSSKNVSFHYLDMFRDHIKKVLEKDTAFNIKDLKINGNDLKKVLNISEGKTIGSILNLLLEAVLDDPELNERNKLLEISENLVRKYFI